MATPAPVDEEDDDAWLQADAAGEYDSIAASAERSGNQSLVNALLEFWRMLQDIRREPDRLNGLTKLPRAAGADDGTQYWLMVCCPDDEGVAVVIGDKGGRIQALAFERFGSPLGERLWKDAQSRANARASERSVSGGPARRRKR